MDRLSDYVEIIIVQVNFCARKVVSLDEYASYFEKIDPVSQYKTWKTKLVLHGNSHSGSAERVKAAFVVSDPVDWGRDIQVFPISVSFCCDIYTHIHTCDRD